MKRIILCGFLALLHASLPIAAQTPIHEVKQNSITYSLYEKYDGNGRDVLKYNLPSYSNVAVVTDAEPSVTSLDPKSSITYNGKTYNVVAIDFDNENTNITTIHIPVNLQYAHYIFTKNLPNVQYFLNSHNNTNVAVSGRGNNCIRTADKKTILLVAPNSPYINDGSMEGAEAIGPYAFEYCQFTTLKIPDTVTDIDQNAFSGFSKLESFEATSTNRGIYRAENGVLYKYSGTTSDAKVEALASFPDAKTGVFTLKMNDGSVPSTILPYACDDCKFSSFNIPAVASSACMTIKERAFYNASMSEFNSKLPIYWIETAAFENCKITAFIAQGGSAWDKLDTNGRQINFGKNAFLNSTIKNVQFPYGKTQDVAIYIGEGAFENCATLETLYFLSYTESSTQSLIGELGKRSFYHCTNLRELNLSNHKYLPIIFRNPSIFEGCTSLAKVKLVKNSVLSVGDNAFMACSMDGWWFYNQAESLQSIGKWSFAPYNPETINSDGTAARNNFSTTSTHKFNISEFSKLSSIGAGAFNACKINNENLSIYHKNQQSVLTKIEEFTFSGNNFKYFTFPARGVTEIGADAFASSSETLVGLTLPKTLETIEWTHPWTSHNSKSLYANYCNAFPYYFRLEYISIGTRGNKETVTDNGKYKCSPRGFLYDAETMTLLQSPAAYSHVDHPGGLVLEDEIKGIKALGIRAFSRNENFEIIVLPSTLETIGGEAFYETTKLKSLTIPATVTKVGRLLFRLSSVKDIFVTPSTPPTLLEDMGLNGSSIYAYGIIGLTNRNIYVKKTALSSYQASDIWSKEDNKIDYKIPFPPVNKTNNYWTSICRDFDISCNTNLWVTVITGYENENTVKSATLNRYVPSRVGENNDIYVGALIANYTINSDKYKYDPSKDYYQIGEKDYASGKQETRSDVIGENNSLNWLVGCPIPYFIRPVNDYLYGLKGNKFHFYECNGVIPMNKAYLNLTGREYSASGTSSKTYSVTFPDIEDELEDVITDINSPIVEKNIYDGVQDVYYTLDGVRVKTPLAKGIYIKNGKKVVVK